jgi:uncharacterized DUF497 family protein
MEFEFDSVKSAANRARHGIDFETARALRDDENGISAPAISLDEERWMRIAALHGKCRTAIFTVRRGIVRLISVRRSRPGEARHYERQDDRR